MNAPRGGRHFVYGLYGRKPGVDPEEAVAYIYVGVTSNLRRRLSEHRRKWWWAAVVLELCEFVEYNTRTEADRAERDLIELYQPAMNRTHIVGAARRCRTTA